MTAPVVVLSDLTGQQAQVWDTLMTVAGDLGDGWTLIGGQMVLLHQAERQPAGAGPVGAASMRWSYDVDVVVNLRTSRARMRHIDSVLRDHGFEQQVHPIGHRYLDAGGTVFDVLAPDHLGRHLPRLGRGNTLQASGGTQALKRSKVVEVEHNQQRTPIPRPDLVGALLIKIAAASGPPTGRGNQRHFKDVITLTALITPQDAASAVLTRNERKRIRRAVEILCTGRPLSGPDRNSGPDTSGAIVPPLAPTLQPPPDYGSSFSFGGHARCGARSRRCQRGPRHRSQTGG